jgi:GNAT superfamily N-acetyltransferase
MSNIPDNVFIVPGYHSTVLQAENQAALQTLLEKCADYSLLVTGNPPKPSAAACLLADCPAGKTLADKYVIGFSTGNQDLLGVLDAIRDYPTQDDWWLGLLLLDPAQCNQGLGRRIYQSFEHWARQKGARRIFLGVLEENQKAYQFWQSLGFEVVERQIPRQFGNKDHTVIVMKSNIVG